MLVNLFRECMHLTLLTVTRQKSAEQVGSKMGEVVRLI